jgi:hypothetical protein
MKQVLALLTLLCISCASGVKSMRIREGFVYETFSKKNFFIAPAVNRSGVGSLDHAEILLEKAFRSERKNLSVYGADYTLSKLDARGKGLLYGLRRDLKMDATPKGEQVRELSGVLGQSYVIVPVLEYFNVIEYENREDVPVLDGKRRVKDTVTVYTDNTKSAIHGSLHVFNLETGDLDLYVLHEKNLIISESRTERGCLDGFFYRLLNPATAPAGPDESAEHLFADMVESFPGKGDTIRDCTGKENCRLLD